MLSNNNMLTTGGRSQRQRRCVRVNEPAYGFFVTGSSLEAMNGVYIRRNPPRVPAESADPVAALYYEHEDGLWHLSLNELPDANTESDDDEFDEDRLWYDPKPKKPTHEWVFTDEFGRTRFLHDGDTIIPGAGVRWKHAHRESTQSTLSVEEPSVSAVATISEDDEDELPWQVIAILDVETVQDLLWSSQCRKQKVKDAMAGRTAKSPAPSSLEGMFTPGAWLFRVKTAEGVTLFEEPSVESKEAGRRDCGEYLKGIEMSKNGDWLRLDSSEDNEGRHNSFLDDDNDDIGHFFSQRSKHHYYNSVYSRRELWVKIFEDNGWAGSYPLLEEIGPNETAVLGLKAIGEVEKSENQDDSDVMQISGHTGDYFDRPFVHRMEDGCQDDNSAPNISSEVDEFVESLQQDKLDGITAIPVGSAVYICGLSSRSERQYNNVPGIIVQTTDKFGKVGVRLSTPFSGKLISCHTDNVMFRQNDEDMELTDTDKSQAKGGKDELKRAAQLLGLMLTQIGLHNADSQSDDTAWGFRGHGAEQKVKTALRCFLRATNGVFGGEDIGRDAARVLLREIRKTEPFSSSRTEDWAPCSPVRLISQGALGEDVAAAVRASLDPSSALSRKSGLSALQKCLVSEKRRVQQQAQAVYTMEEDIDLGESSHGADELLLRLALIQCLLENRREADALDEAKCLVKFEEDHVLTSSPDSSAVVSYLLGCCLLRLGMRGPGLNALENSKIVDLPESIEWLSPLQFWGFQEASRMMKVQKASEQYKAAAVESYSRGSFEEAASLYAKAIEILEVGCIEDKHGRAMCLADKAGCLRRARQLEKAVEELDAALRLFPRYTRALFRRAACLLEMGKASDAIEAFKTLYRVDRNWPHLSEWLVRAYTLRKRQSRGNYRPPDDGQQYDNPRDSKMNSAESTPLGGASSEADSIAVEVDLYAVLGVSTDATDKQLKTAYRMRSLKYHPDKKGGHTSAFQRIAEAYDILSDPEKRQAYDEGGDIKVKRGRRDEDDDSDDSEEEHKTSMREEVEREFYPEKYHFWPFGDPFIYKRKREAQKRKKQGRPAWQEDPWL